MFSQTVVLKSGKRWILPATFCADPRPAKVARRMPTTDRVDRRVEVSATPAAIAASPGAKYYTSGPSSHDRMIDVLPVGRHVVTQIIDLTWMTVAEIQAHTVNGHPEDRASV